MHTRSLVTHLALTLLAGAAAPLLAAPPEKPTIADIAPAQTLVVASLDDYPRARAALPGSHLGRLLSDPDVARASTSLLRLVTSSAGVGGDTLEVPPLEEIERYLSDELGIDPEDLPEPAGQIGFAVFVSEAAPDGQSPAERPLALLLSAEFGAGAAALEDALDRLAERAEQKGFAIARRSTHQGATIRSFYDPQHDPDAKDKAPKAEADPEDPFAFEDFDPEPLLTGLHVARVGAGGSFVACSDLPALRALLDRLAGANQNALAASEVYRDSSAKVTPGSLLTAMVLIEPLAQLASGPGGAQLGALGGGGVLSNLLPLLSYPETGAVLTGLGIKGTRSIILSTLLDTPEAVVQSDVLVLGPRGGGLLGLFQPIQSFTPPAYVPADAASFGMTRYDFSQILPNVRSIVAGLPEEFRGLVEPQLTPLENVAGPALRTLGPELVSYQRLERPIDQSSARQVVAIASSDTAPLSSVLGAFGGAVGLTSRAFEGATIWGLQADQGPLPVPVPSVGVATGQVFIGSAKEIENAIRLSSAAQQGADQGLAADPAFRAATAALSPGAIGYSFGSTARALEFSFESLKLTSAQAQEQHEEFLRQFELDRDDYPAPNFDWIKDLPAPSTITKYIGDSVAEFRLTPDGVLMRQWILKPAR
ncbi:MAG: hypothetical protein C0475_05120 [Planctomyces sp.]|nr:hypothetical protein [Planctomyces sp.]MBA4119784.1 hypothetical protein [Isosphaera sp.]